MVSPLLCGLREYKISIKNVLPFDRYIHIRIITQMNPLQCAFLQIKLGILTSNRIHTIHHISIIEDQVFK